MFKWDEIKATGLGPLNLSHDELFALTPFQFAELWEGYQERDRISEIKRAQILVTIVNANRWDEKQREAKIEDVLPWYPEYIEARQPVKTPAYKIPDVDLSISQLERITKRLLEQKGLDSNKVKKDSPEWLETERVAISCVTGGQSYTLETLETDGSRPPQGIQYKKADPNEWGRPPWEVEDEIKAKALEQKEDK